MASTDALFERYYYDRPDFRNGQDRFYDLVERSVPAGGEILEIGAGPENARTKRWAAIGPVTGVDISDEVFDNPDLARAERFDGLRLPFADDSFDACVSVYVLEHVEHPEAHFREIARVLKPGGVYAFWTPNLYHYVSAGSNLLPHSVHLMIANPMRGRDEEEHDPYPTFYRANTGGQIERLCHASGLEVVAMHHIEPEPSYGRAHPALFWPMMAYERLVNRFGALSGLRANLQGLVRVPR